MLSSLIKKVNKIETISVFKKNYLLRNAVHLFRTLSAILLPMRPSFASCDKLQSCESWYQQMHAWRESQTTQSLIRWGLLFLSLRFFYMHVNCYPWKVSRTTQAINWRCCFSFWRGVGYSWIACLLPGTSNCI